MIRIWPSQSNSRFVHFYTKSMYDLPRRKIIIYWRKKMFVAFYLNLSFLFQLFLTLIFPRFFKTLIIIPKPRTRKLQFQSFRLKPFSFFSYSFFLFQSDKHTPVSICSSIEWAELFRAALMGSIEKTNLRDHQGSSIKSLSAPK